MAPAKLKSKKEEWQIVADIIRAVEEIELTKYPAWNDLDMLSSHTIIDGITVDPAGVIVTGDKFSGLLNVYVALEYGSGSEAFVTTDSFLGEFAGHLVSGEPHIDDLTIDTSSFYK
jgi:Predicted pPIWI-associating nuclease